MPRDGRFCRDRTYLVGVQRELVVVAAVAHLVLDAAEAGLGSDADGVPKVGNYD